MRLIDAEALKAELTENFHETWHYTGIRAVIDNAPTIDAEPVRHGHWEKCDLTDGKDVVALGYKRCSVCHDLGFLNEDAYGYWNSQTLSTYCPNCGAKMDEEER